MVECRPCINSRTGPHKHRRLPRVTRSPSMLAFSGNSPYLQHVGEGGGNDSRPDI